MRGAITHSKLEALCLILILYKIKTGAKSSGDFLIKTGAIKCACEFKNWFLVKLFVLLCPPLRFSPYLNRHNKNVQEEEQSENSEK